MTEYKIQAIKRTPSGAPCICVTYATGALWTTYVHEEGSAGE